MQVGDETGNLGISDIWTIPEGGSKLAASSGQDDTYKKDKR